MFSKEKSVIPTKNIFSMNNVLSPERDTTGFLKAYSDVGWLYAVCFRIALGCSEVKWTLTDVSNREKPKQIYNHKILDLLKLVNPTQTSNEFIALHTIYKLLIGESFWVINNNLNNEPGEIVLAYPQKMSVVPAKNFPMVKGYVYGSGAEAIPFTPEEVIHFKEPNPLNQYRGLGGAQAIGINLDAQMNADKWINQFFYNSARPDGVIEYDYDLSDEQFDKLSKQWKEKHQGVSKAHSVALLEGGGKYVQIQNTVKDMDFPNLQLRNRDVILGVFGMPLSVMGISENVNKANAEAGDYTFARWLIKPRLDWDKAKIQEQLIPKFKNSANLEIGYEEVVPETIDQKRELAESGMRAGYLTINEARKLRGLDPMPNGDVLLIPLNLLPTTPESLDRPIQTPTNNAGDTPTPIVEPPVKGKGYTPEQKKEIWARKNQKILRQEEMFKGVFSKVLKEQEKDILTYFEQSGNLPELNDNDTAKKFQPAIKEVYENSFKEAI